MTDALFQNLTGPLRLILIAMSCGHGMAISIRPGAAN